MYSSQLSPELETPEVAADAPALNQPGPSYWIWIPFVWLFLVSTRSVSRWLTITAVDATTVDPDQFGSPWDRALLTLLMALGLCVLIARFKRTKEILRNNKWLVVLFLYMASSVIWSNFPDITMRRWFRSAGALMMVLVALTESDPLGSVRALLRRLYLVHIPLSIIAIKYFRNIGVAYTWNGLQEMWVGLAVHKNNLGQVATCSGLVSTWQVLQNWSRKKLSLDLVLLLLTLWVLEGSQTSHSSTAILAFLFSASVLLVLQFLKHRAYDAKRIILGTTLAIALLAPFAYIVLDYFDTLPAAMVLGATGRNATFSDRTYLWQDLLDNAAKRPVLGVGYGAFWVGPIGYALYPLPNWSLVTLTWRPGEGHNGYLDVYVQLGAVGVALVLLVIGSAIGGALDDIQHRFELGSLRLTLLLSILVNNVAESSLLDGTHSLWFLFLIAAVRIPAANPIPAETALADSAAADGWV